MIKKAFLNRGVYFYLLPNYTQAKKILWDGMTNDGFKFMDFIPKGIIMHKNDTELKVTLINGSIVQLVGSENIDALRGTNPIGVVFSEFAYHNPMAWDVLRPILAVNQGFAWFDTSCNGKNHAYDLWESAKDDPAWFCTQLNANDVGIPTLADIEQERKNGMSEEMVQQEFFNSWDIGMMGAYYTQQILEARKQGRICNVPIEKSYPVECYFDLGKSDTTAILFTQCVGKEIRIIDSYEASGEEIAHYVRVLKEKGYWITRLNLPHDATHKRLESNKTVEEQFREAGFKTRIVDKIDINNGIQEVRKIFPRLWIDQNRCKDFLRAMENYHREYDASKKVFKDRPLHDYSSNYADSARYLAVGYREVKKKEKTKKAFNPYSAF